MKTVSAPQTSPVADPFSGVEGLDPLVLVAIALLAICASVFSRLSRRPRRYRPSAAQTHTPAAKPKQTPIRPITRLTEPHPQARNIEAVAKVSFRKKRLLNKGEYRLLRALEDLLPQFGGQYRLMAQTSLSEIIEPIGTREDKDWKNAFHAINAKRLDFAIFDSGGFLVCAIEYQGEGHYQDGAFMRDAVKREALRLAGVPLVEITPDVTREELRILIGRHLAGSGRSVAAS